MICTNCFAADYQSAKTDLDLTIDGQDHLLRGIDCESCPACGEITFTQAQSLEIDKKRIALEFGAKPILAPAELRTLRRVLNMSLNELCDLLHIGRNSYGRWERGEVEITPSMNLLVHNLIDRVLDAPVNIFVRERLAAIEKANASLVRKDLTFGQYLRDVIAFTKLIPDIVSTSVEIAPSEFARIENDEFPPERIPHEVTAKLAHYFSLPFDALSHLLDETLKAALMQGPDGSVPDLCTPYDGKGGAPPADHAGGARGRLAQPNGKPPDFPKVGAEYLAQVKAALERLEGTQSR